MIRLAQIEWLKIKQYRTFWVLTALFAVLLPLWNYGLLRGMINFGGDKKGMNFLSSAYSFPEVWANLGFWGSIFIPFVSILVIILTTNEYTFRTNRQNVIDGWSRIDFFHAKIILVFGFSLIATTYLFLLGVIFGRIQSGSFSNVFSELHKVFYFFILCLDYLGFALIISLLIKRSGLAIGLFFLYSLIIENLLRSIINYYSNKPLGNLLPLQSSDELLPYPLLQMAKSLIGAGPAISFDTYALCTVGWCCIYYISGRMLLAKNDW